jgi:hypothetical protein
MKYVADQDESGFWYVRESDEIARPVECRDWNIIIAADKYEDKGKKVAEQIADMLTQQTAVSTTRRNQ